MIIQMPFLMVLFARLDDMHLGCQELFLKYLGLSNDRRPSSYMTLKWNMNDPKNLPSQKKIISCGQNE